MQAYTSVYGEAKIFTNSDQKERISVEKLCKMKVQKSGTKHHLDKRQLLFTAERLRKIKLMLGKKNINKCILLANAESLVVFCSMSNLGQRTMVKLLQGKIKH